METRVHPRTKVLPAVAWKQAPNGYPFFALFFYCGLCPPFSEFFCDIMNTYGFRLLDFTPNAVLTMAVFAHLCENFVGVHPNVAFSATSLCLELREESLYPAESPGSRELA
ncbi:unnamed protein product [Triticum aestivum]|uniref:Transposase (putative) gypsy type domain-containing protein n=1 Tax=Triticum aestivum TaxID=4565 RepID=A0A7H4LNV8_WHEAT|nr:unnamed protein product [Triticum aestivum]